MPTNARFAFLACVERGRLEQEAVLLCRSIRRYAGRHRDAPIHTFAPRLGMDVTAATRDQLAMLNVVHHELPLNTSLPDYGMANKVFSCAWAEEHLDADVLVFLDSDTVMIGEPSALVLPADVSAAVRPADSVPMNSTGPGHPMEPYWMDVYKFCGIETEPYVRTELGRWVRAYFSAGLVAVRRDRGLFQCWRDNLLSLVAANLLPRAPGIARMDEVSLVATLIPEFSRLRCLCDRYNYLIYRRSRLEAPWRNAELEHIVHVHYRGSFNNAQFFSRLEPPIAPDSPIRHWLEQFMPLIGGPSISARGTIADHGRSSIGRSSRRHP